MLPASLADEREISLVATAVVAVLLMVSPPLMAHHGGATFDATKAVTVKGTVTDFQFVNPHAQVFFEAKDKQGKPEAWQGEFTSPNRLARAGWTPHTLKPGDSITVTGNPAKHGARTLLIRKLVAPGGVSLPLFQD